MTASIPKATLKKVMKMDEDTSKIGSEALVVMQKATELFLTTLAEATLAQTDRQSRIVKYDDVHKAVQANSGADGGLDLTFLKGVVPRQIRRGPQPGR